MKTSGSSPSVKENASSPKSRNKKKRFPYLRAVPDILKFQAVTALLLGLLLWGLEAAAMEMIISTGRVAVSSGDYLFIFTCWQGWALILLGVFVFLLYVIFDLNMKIFFSDALIRSGKVSFRKVITDSILSGRRFFSPAGLGIVLFISLLAPLAGIGISISLTEGLYIPSFITSVIYANPVLNVLYRALLAAVFVIGILHLFQDF